MKFDKRNLSPVAIAQELQDAVALLPDGESWEDYFEGGTGRTIIELIAGSQAIKNHYNLMRVREGTLQYAKLDSSVTELAINKGVYRPPAKSHIIEITFNALSSGWLNRGNVIGAYKNYDVIVYETAEYIFGRENTVKVTIGKREEFTKTILDAEEFYQQDIKALYKYLGSEFQSLSINNEEVILVDEELNLYDDRLADSCVRLTYEGFTRLVFGDGVIGRKLEVNDELVFNFISYGDDLIENFKVDAMSFGTFADAAEILSMVTLRKATPYIDKETLRKIAIRNSVDGRWVQTQDYQNGILREFGGYIADVIVKDDYPAENITILPKEDYLTPTVQADLEALIENKRGNAVLIDLVYLDPYSDQRLELIFNVQYIGTDTEEFLDSIISDYVSDKLDKIQYNGYYLTCADIAVDLTHLSPGGKFYGSLDEQVYIEPLNSIKSLIINYSK